MSKPLIGITCGAITRNTGELCYGVMPAYTRSVALAGGLPLLIAPNVDNDVLRELCERVDAVLLTGGGDVDPELYGMTDDGLVTSINPDRDRSEIEITRWAAGDNKPLLGICRGVQVVNVALGGTLYRDIPSEYQTDFDHELSSKIARDHAAHDIQIDSGSKLADVLGLEKVHVNTLHHQALREVAPRLTITAHATDGIIEGVELPDSRFFVGVQWHPEEMTTYSEPMRRLFGAFVDAARQ